MITNKIVARFQDGRVLKGFTSDFMPGKEYLHLLPEDAQPDAKPLLINIPELKAIFFVKDFRGDPKYKQKKVFDEKHPVPGRKIKVLFSDGELLIGTTQGYQPGRPGFFVFPADLIDNNERCYVVSSATKDVSLI